jgi:hypothetical protein
MIETPPRDINVRRLPLQILGDYGREEVLCKTPAAQLRVLPAELVAIWNVCDVLRPLSRQRDAWIRIIAESRQTSRETWQAFMQASAPEGVRKAIVGVWDSLERLSGWMANRKANRSFQRLIEQGLLLSEDQIYQALRSEEAHFERSRIDFITLVVRNRIQTAVQCVETLIDNANQFGWRATVLVIDDSDGEANRDILLTKVSALAKTSPIELRYIGLRERESLYRELVRRSQVAPEVIRFALFGDRSPISRIGSSRNLALLLTAGSMVLNVDDETVCRISLPFDATSGVAFSSERDENEEYSVLETQRQTGRRLVPASQNLPSAHERLLGLTIPQVLQKTGRTDPIDLSNVKDPFLWSMLTGSGQVIMTLNGFTVSDSKSTGAEGPLETTACMAPRTTVTQITLTDGPHRMDHCVGLDNRRFLPPFFPMSEVNDLLFGETVKYCCPTACTGHIPLALLHSSDVCGTLPFQGLSFSIIIGVLMKSAASDTHLKDPERACQSLGRELVHFADEDLEVFKGRLRLRTLEYLADQIHSRRRLLETSGNTTKAWRTSMERSITELSSALLAESVLLPVEVRELPVDKALKLTHNLVIQFGNLLQSWGALRQVSEEIKNEGGLLDYSISPTNWS